MNDKTKRNIPTQDQIAKQAGVSRETLRKATKLLDEDPKEAALVKAGKKTLQQALRAVKEAKASADVSTNHKQIVARLTKVCGKNFANAYEEGSILKSASEAMELCALEDAMMKEVAEMVLTGWKVKPAVRCLTQAIDSETTLGDLIGRAIKNKGTFSVVISCHKITVTKLDTEKC